MPKLYDNLRENIVSSAKEVLLKDGYEALTVRGIAGNCGIAVGTVYNYFSSKEMLAASVMLEDWLYILKRMQESCAHAVSVREGLTAVYDGLVAYTGIYHNVWSGYTFSEGAKSALGERHILLVRQLAEIIQALFVRLGKACDSSVAIFFSESILTCAGNSELTFDALLTITKPILT